MSESESTEVVDSDTKHECNPRKRLRHRKKQLYANILKQMEFYFSDANLCKDRFLGDLVKNDPYVPLEVFLKFNKIRSMTHDITDIAKAMKHTVLLELSEDRLKVKRKAPVLPYDADARTVYVESIPVTASREWLERVFSDYGTVAYISLPKFKNSQKIKGYGFVEFVNPEDAHKCINTFTKMGCKLPTCMPPEELSSIKMFSVDNPSEPVDNMELKDFYEPPKKKAKKPKDKKSKNADAKLNESDSEKVVETPTEENKSICTPTEESKTDVEESKDETSHDDSKETDMPRKKKNRKKSSKNKSKNLLGPKEAPKAALWGLQVLSKSEWKGLRNKYLNLQRKYMKDVKRNVMSKRHYAAIPEPANPALEAEPELNPGQVEGEKSLAVLERKPGLFVKEILPEPCIDVRLMKRTIRTNAHALHVDVKEGQNEVVIRFDTSEAAEEYCRSSSNPTRVLHGSEEDLSWAGLWASRARRRGRVRLRQRGVCACAGPDAPQPTVTHIRFDE